MNKDAIAGIILGCFGLLMILGYAITRYNDSTTNPTYLGAGILFVFIGGLLIGLSKEF